MTFQLNPSNDLYLQIALKTVDPETQAVIPLTTGTVQAFLATSNSPTATAADPSLVTTCTYSSRTHRWMIAFDGSLLTPALMASLFASATPYCIVTVNGTDVRAAIPLKYVASRAITPG